MKRRILALILATFITTIGIVLPVTAEVVYSGELGDSLTWEIDDTAYTLTIKGTGAMPDFSWRTPPEYSEYYDYIDNVIIEEGVTSIGEYAFYDCSYVETISIPSTVTSIAGTAFDYPERISSFTVAENNPSFCTDDENLYSKDKTQLIRYCPAKRATEWTIPNSVTTLNPYSLSYTRITNLTIPDSVKTIEENALVGGKWEDLHIPSSVETIEDGAIAACENLSQITVDTNNPNYCSIDGVLFTKDKTTICQYPSGASRISYCIPDYVKNISSSAFDRCSLHTLAIPDGLESIGKYAFQSCYNLSVVLNSGTEFYMRRLLSGGAHYSIYEDNLINEWDKTPAKLGAFNCYYNEGTLYICPDFKYILKDGTLCIAIYDTDETLKTIKTVDASVDSLNPTIEITSAEDLTGCSVKAFFVDGISSFIPLSIALDTSIKHGTIIKDVVLDRELFDRNDAEYNYSGDCSGINVTFTPTSYTRDPESYFIINDYKTYTVPKIAGRTISVSGNTVKISIDSGNGGFKTQRIAVIF